MKSYQKLKIQVKNRLSLERHVTTGIPQSFEDGSLLFDLFLSDQVFSIEKHTLSNPVDHNNLFTSREYKALTNSLL